MSRVRRRPHAYLLALAGSASACWLLVGPTASGGEPLSPTVTFTANGAPPIACGTRPDVGSLAVPEGTAILIANQTGVSASVMVGGAPVLTVADGEGASLTLAPGQHDVRLAPECGVVTRTWSLAVSVTSPPPSPSGPAAAPPPPSSPPPLQPPPEAATNPSSVDHSAETPAGGTSGPPTPADVLVGASDAASASPSAGPVPAPDVLRAETVALAGGSPSKGVRLLAAIATICVLGVTAAIIRSIVRLDA